MDSISLMKPKFQHVLDNFIPSKSSQFEGFKQNEGLEGFGLGHVPIQNPFFSIKFFSKQETEYLPHWSKPSFYLCDCIYNEVGMVIG